MEYEFIAVERPRDGVGLIRFTASKYPVLNSRMLSEIAVALRDLDSDESIGAMVITGTEKAFAAGADIKEMSDKSAAEMLTLAFIDLFDAIRSIKKPVIAAVSGYVLGGGNELAMACDMIVASETAQFGQPEINLGIIPGAGGTQRLTRAVGKAVAMEMVLDDRRLSAEEALQFGLVNRVAPKDKYLDEAIALAGRIAARAPIAVRLGKEAVNKAFELSLSEGLDYERKLFYFLFATEDQKEGMAAFLEKRPARWRGK